MATESLTYKAGQIRSNFFTKEPIRRGKLAGQAMLELWIIKWCARQDSNLNILADTRT
jgi:hypothetical protein